MRIEKQPGIPQPRNGPDPGGRTPSPVRKPGAGAFLGPEKDRSEGARSARPARSSAEAAAHSGALPPEDRSTLEDFRAASHLTEKVREDILQDPQGAAAGQFGAVNRERLFALLQ